VPPLAPPSLKGVTDRLAWADKHLEALYGEARAFTEREPHTVVSERDPESGWETACFQLREEPPLSASASFSETCSTPRSTTSLPNSSS
jgi:hypothetical protein